MNRRRQKQKNICNLIGNEKSTEIKQLLRPTDARTKKACLCTVKDEYQRLNVSATKLIAENVRMIGLSRVLDHKRSKFQRVVWSILITLSLVFLVYHLTDRIIYYSDAPIIADVTIGETRHHRFPYVTLCHQLDIKDTHIRFLRKYSNLSSEEWKAYLAVIDRYKFSKEDLQRQSIDFNRNRTFWIQLWRKAFLPKSVLKCEFIKDPVNFTVFDCANMWRPTHLTDFYRARPTFGCYTLENNWTAGIESFLKIQLQLIKQDTAVSFFRLTVHDQDEAPQLRENNVKIYAQPKTTMTKWDVRFKMTDLKLTRSRCEKGGLKYLKGNYNTLKCKLDHITQYSMDKCGCHIPWEYDQIDLDLPICHPVNWTYCFKAAWDKHNKAEDLGEKCVSACRKKIFDFSAAAYKLRAKKKYQKGRMGQYIQLYLKFVSTHYLAIEQREAFGMLRLLSEVGGALGLCLGIRLLTIAEIVDVGIVFFWRKMFQFGAKKNGRTLRERNIIKQNIPPTNGGDQLVISKPYYV